MLILAIDLGKFNSMCCFFDTENQQSRFQKVPTDRGYLESFLTTHPVDLIAFEACGPSGWLHDLCQQLEIKTLVSSTNDEAWQWKKTKRKTDKDDALKLARLAMLNQLQPVHVPSPEGREARMLIKYRKTVDGRINRIKNAVRSLFANHGIPIDSGKRAWCSGRKHIDAFRKPLSECEPHELWRGELDLELTQLDALTEQLQKIEARLESSAEANEHVQRLMTIPGVGRKTAEALVAAIDDPHRFHNARQVASYVGLVPKQHQSGETDRNGRITKRGSRLLRTLLVECAWVSTRYNRWAKKFYERVHGGQRTRRKKAGVALARKLVTIAWAMMRDETEWEPARLLPPEEINEATIKVTQQPNHPPGEVLHLPKHLREEEATSASRMPLAEFST